MLACAAALAGGLVLAQFRGFDMLDGAYYFLAYQDPADNADSHTHFSLLARPLWLLCARNIVAFRILCIGLFSGAAVTFWRRWRLFLPTGGARPWALMAIWLAAMAGLCWVPVALTYNSLATLFDLLGFAALLAWLGGSECDRLRGGARLAAGALVLAAVVGLYLSKPPAAFAFIAGAWLLICFEPGLPMWLRRALFWAAFAVALAVAGAVARATARADFNPKAFHFIWGLKLTPSWIVATLRRYGAELSLFLPALWRDLAWTLGPAAVACGAALWRTERSSGARRLLGLGLAAILASLSAALVLRRLWDGSFSSAVAGGAARFYLLAWITLLPAWLAVRWRAAGAGLASWCWIPVLLAVPLCGSLGTTNTLIVAALHATVLWAAGLILMASDISVGAGAPWFRAGVAALLCAGAACHLFTGLCWRPYMFQPPLWRQTQSVEIGYPATSLRVDPALARFLAEVRGALDRNGFKPGDDAFGFFNLPGVVFAIGAREPGAPWYFGTWYNRLNSDGDKLMLVPEERRRRAWVITQDDVTIFRDRFAQCGINFPGGYTRIGQSVNPVSGLKIEIWKPNARN